MKHIIQAAASRIERLKVNTELVNLIHKFSKETFNRYDSKYQKEVTEYIIELLVNKGIKKERIQIEFDTKYGEINTFIRFKPSEVVPDFIDKTWEWDGNVALLTLNFDFLARR